MPRLHDTPQAELLALFTNNTAFFPGHDSTLAQLLAYAELTRRARAASSLMTDLEHVLEFTR